MIYIKDSLNKGHNQIELPDFPMEPRFPIMACTALDSQMAYMYRTSASFCHCSPSTSFAGRQHSCRHSSKVDHGLQARPRGCAQMRDMSCRKSHCLFWLGSR